MKRYAIVFSTVVIFLMCVWAMSNIKNEVKFFSTPGDYPAMSLAHAVNMDLWFAGIASKKNKYDSEKLSRLPFNVPQWLLTGMEFIDTHLPGNNSRSVGYFQTMHPGIPFQLTSWLTYRISTLGFDGGSLIRAKNVFGDPSDFWKTNQIIALIITLITAIILLRQSLFLGIFCSLSIALVFFTYLPSWSYSISMLGNETFALPLGIAVFSLAQSAFAEENPTAWRWLVLGFLCGLSYLNKLNYILWAVAVVCGLIVSLIVRKQCFRFFLYNTFRFILGFIGCVFIVGGLWLGIRGLGMMSALHFLTVFKTGLYGSGHFGIADATEVLKASHNLIVNNYLFFIFTALLFVLTLVIICKHRKSAEWLRREAPYVVCLLIAFILCLFATLKHYAEHYLIPAAVILPMLIFWIGQNTTRYMRYLLAAVVFVLVVFNFSKYIEIRRGMVSVANISEKDIRDIRQYPIQENEVRLWSYRVYASEYLSHFIGAMVNRPEISKIIEDLYPKDLESNLWLKWDVMYHDNWASPEKVPWRYAIFDKAYVPSKIPLSEYLRAHSRIVFDGAQIMVVERLKEGIR